MSADCDEPEESGDPPEQLKAEEMGKKWSKLDMGNLWEVPPPDWAVERERGQMGLGVSVMGKELAAKAGAGVKEGEWGVNGEKEGKQGAVEKVENYSEYGGDGRRREGGGEGFGGGGGGEGYGEEGGGEVGGEGYGGECGYDGGEGRGREGESWRGDG